MKLLSESFSPRSTILIRVIALIGFADSIYLSAQHFLNRIPPCSVVEGCETVLTSEYAVISGVPLALLGVVFYLLMLAVPSRALATAGFMASLVLLYLQLFVIDAICLYCLVSLGTSTLLFITTLYAYNSGDGSVVGREEHQG